MNSYDWLGSNAQSNNDSNKTDWNLYFENNKINVCKRLWDDLRHDKWKQVQYITKLKIGGW